MLTPEQLDKYPDSLVKLYTKAEMDIIADIARRIATYDYFIPAAEFQYRKAIEMGNVHDDIFKRLSKVTGKRVSELEDLFEEAGYQTLKVDDAIYKAAGLEPLSIKQSPALINVLKAGMSNTNGLFENLTRTAAQTGSRQFEQILDRTYMQVVTGSFDTETAMRRAVKSLSEKGIAVIEYPNGHKNYIEAAVRRATLTGVNQTAMKLQDVRADEMGCDLVETSAHAGARPSHAIWQGKIFSRSGSNPKYQDFKVVTGYGTGAGLGGWNCKHNYYPFFEGISTRAYTEKDLEEMEAEKYTYNGHKMNEADAIDKQRYIERNIRRWKREYAGMKAINKSTNEAAAKIAQWNRIHDDYLDQTGLKKQIGRMNIG